MTDCAQGARMKPDELWDKYAHRSDSPPHITYTHFLAALKEYGELVKAEAVKVARNKIDMYSGNHACANYCAAAIEKMELP